MATISLQLPQDETWSTSLRPYPWPIKGLHVTGVGEVSRIAFSCTQRLVAAV